MADPINRIHYHTNSTNRVQRYTELTSCNGSHSPTLRPTPNPAIAMSLASCTGTVCTTILADSGEGVLLRQSDSAVVFFPITCAARSASPPLCITGHYETIHSHHLRPHNLPRISNLLANASLARAHLQTSLNRLFHRRCIWDTKMF